VRIAAIALSWPGERRGRTDGRDPPSPALKEDCSGSIYSTATSKTKKIIKAGNGLKNERFLSI